MPVNVPPPAPAPVYSWTGWYVGGNVGYGWGLANTDLGGNVTTTNIIGGNRTPTPPFSEAFANSNTAHPNGVIGGAQIGYNYQFSPYVVLGFEADIQGSGERGSGQITDDFTTSACSTTSVPCTLGSPINVAAVTSFQSKIDWFGTVRGRLGVINGDQLIYATGGLAYGKVGISGTANVSAVVSASGAPFAPATAAFSASNTNTGFAVGGGVEGKLYWLPANWTWKLEYLYLDLGSLDTTGSSFSLAPPVATNLHLTGAITTHTHFTDNIARVGLNYQFH